MSEGKERALARRMARQQELGLEKQHSKSRKTKKPFVLEEFIPAPENPDPRPDSFEQLNIRIGYYEHWMLWGHYHSLQDALKAKDALMRKGLALAYPGYRMRVRLGDQVVWENSTGVDDE